MPMLEARHKIIRIADKSAASLLFGLHHLWVANSQVAVPEGLLIDLPPAIAAFKLPSHEGTLRGICAAAERSRHSLETRWS
jgi:hypothetical protein